MAQADQTRKQQNEQDTTVLLADQQKANRRLRIFAYFGISVLIIGVVITVVLGVINTVGLGDEQTNSRQARADNHTLLERSANGSEQAVKLFNQALAVLREVGQANVLSQAQAEQDLIEIFKFNGFKIPPNLPKPPPSQTPAK